MTDPRQLPDLLRATWSATRDIYLAGGFSEAAARKLAAVYMLGLLQSAAQPPTEIPADG